MRRAEASDRAVARALRNRVRNDFGARGDLKQRRLGTLLFAGVMHEGCVLKNAALDQTERKALQPGAAVFHTPSIQSPKRPHYVGDAATMRPISGGESGV